MHAWLELIAQELTSRSTRMSRRVDTFVVRVRGWWNAACDQTSTGRSRGRHGAPLSDAHQGPRRRAQARHGEGYPAVPQSASRTCHEAIGAITVGSRAVRSGTTRLLGVTALAIGAVVGCASPRVCNGPNRPAPDVLLDGAPWAATHPSDTVLACVNGRCQAISGTSFSEHSLFLPTPAGPSAGRTVTVTVTADERGRQVLRVSRRVRPVRQTEDGPCGKVRWWQTPMTLTAAGELQVRAR